MKFVLIVSAILAISAAKPLEQAVAVTQDTLGNYNLKYAIDGISRAEQRNIHGDVSGGFSYIDPHGVLRKLEFTAGEHGFVPISGDLPQPVQDTPEVAIAKAEHLALLRAAQLEHPTELIQVPVPVRSHTVEIPLETRVPVLRSGLLEVPQVQLVKSFDTQVIGAPLGGRIVKTIPELPLLRTGTPITTVDGRTLVSYEVPSHSKVLISKL